MSGGGTGASRLQAIEMLRVGAMLSVVASHATVSYMRVPTPEVLWAARDRATHGVFDTFFWISGVLLSIFFLVAGFSATALYDGRGPSAFLRDRGRRLLIPFLAAVLVILPSTFYVWAAGWWLDGRCTLDDIRRVKFAPEIQSQLFGPAHLWFLEYLIIYSAAYYVIRAAGRWWTIRLRRVPFGVSACEPSASGKAWPLGWFVAASTLILLVDVGAVANLHNSFVPAPARFLYHGVFFAAGALWLSRPGGLARFTAWGTTAGRLWLPIFVIAFLLFRRYLTAPLTGTERIFVPLAVAGFVWVSVLSSFGLAQRVSGHGGARFELLAAAAYWVYLVHLPIVGAIQLLLARQDGSPFLKFPLVLAITLAVTLWSYRRIVQGSAAAAWCGLTKPLSFRLAESQVQTVTRVATPVASPHG